MYTIGVCDDEKQYRDIIEKQVYELLVKKNVEFEIRTYQDGMSVLEDVDMLDILLLDIRMSKMKGTEVKERIKNTDCKILFVSNYYDLIEETFGKNVMGYIKKDELYKINDKVLKIIYSEQNTQHIIIDKIPIKIMDIVYLKADGSYIEVYMNNQKMLCHIGSLKEIESKIQQFSRVHKSYVVNMKYVKMIHPNLILHNGVELPVSRTYKKIFRDKYFAYMKGE